LKQKSFKEYLNSFKLSPYNFLITNTEEFKEKEKEAGINPTKEEKDIENQKSLLQYLLYANAKN